MCLKQGAPKKPDKGPCNETHGLIGNNFVHNTIRNNTTSNTGGFYITSSTTNSAGNNTFTDLYFDSDGSTSYY